jgi:hypothetical protein
MKIIININKKDVVIEGTPVEMVDFIDQLDRLSIRFNHSVIGGNHNHLACDDALESPLLKERVRKLRKITDTVKKKSLTRFAYHYSKWTAEEDAQVLSNDSIIVLARKLHRSRNSVCSRRYNLLRKAKSKSFISKVLASKRKVQ